MFYRTPYVLFAVFFSLSGCGQDYSLAPPADSEKITVTVKLPKELKTETMWVMYRSATCKRISQGASGQRVERDGHHSVYKEFQRQGQSDLYQIELLKDGGGACKWHLANVTFGVVYADPTQFGENVTYGAGGGVVVIFDYNNSPRGGADIKVDGDLTIKKDYYPWVSESFIGAYKKDVSLITEGNDYFLSYQALKARQVYFEPMLHTGFLVRSEGPKVKKKGNYATFTYPDGSMESVPRAKPDFLKLQTIRTGRAADCFSLWRYANCPDRRPDLLPDWLPEPEKPGYGRYVIVDEWGNELPAYSYRLVGQDGQIFRDKSDTNGRTEPLPVSAHPLRKVEFPVERW
ncbi:hypothetical protein KW846_26865 [Pseudomonas sp. PDM32]|uniref:hypothetical protein n=1 Tax=Pseudomonas sp. PDM32 TaxID=2854768 RepID=UPI001C45B7F2|nr:hypothetical protein [Pseudomonas sp. PDM32]MBV7576346.1 hypothetical protein [Pseudomonas sp. PDM32]